MRYNRVLCVVDDFMRECWELLGDTSLSGTRVARELDGVLATFGKPLPVVSNNILCRDALARFASRSLCAHISRHGM